MSTPPRDLEALRARHATGERFDFLCFWGHRGRADGAPSKACFSQWFPAPFVIDDVRYATAEHWMMAGKARLFGDAAALAKVLAHDDPAKAKAAGRGVRDFDEAIWTTRRFALVAEGNRAKFEAHPPFRDFLLATGDRVLVEASPVDPVWGIGLAADDPAAADPARWRGSNLLGFALMAVREALAAAR